MKKLLSVFCLLFFVFLLSGCTVPQFPWQASAFGAIQVISVPRTAVYLDNKEVGKTPYYNEKLSVGEHMLRLSSDLPSLSVSWQTTVKAEPRVLTIVSRDLGPTDILSSGYTVSLEPLPNGRQSEINIISTPAGAQVSLDNNMAGMTPFSRANVPQGEHAIDVSLGGYQSRNLKVQAVMGYRVLLNMQLAQVLAGTTNNTANTASVSGTITGQNPSLTPTPFAQVSNLPAKPRIKVLDTPTGWLNVRFGPSLIASISAKINPGDYYPYVDEQAGWVEIKYNNGLSNGWVSSQYVEKQL